MALCPLRTATVPCTTVMQMLRTLWYSTNKRGGSRTCVTVRCPSAPRAQTSYLSPSCRNPPLSVTPPPFEDAREEGGWRKRRYKQWCRPSARSWESARTRSQGRDFPRPEHVADRGRAALPLILQCQLGNQRQRGGERELRETWREMERRRWRMWRWRKKQRKKLREREREIYIYL